MKHKKSTSAREAALQALEVYRRCAHTNHRPVDFLHDLTARSGLTDLDKSFAVQLLKGVLQNLILCDYYVSEFSSIKISKIEPKVLDILRLSIYQLLCMSKVPHSAVVNEAVDIAKKKALTRSVAYINAVLRRFSAEVENGNVCVDKIKLESDVKTLSVKYSHPEWVIKEYIDRLDITETEALLSYNNAQSRPLYAQLNTLKTDMPGTLESLKAAGIKAKAHPWLDNCVELHNPGDVTRLDAFRRGTFYIQDPASKLAVLAAAPVPGNIIIDACASPGGKSFCASIHMHNKGEIIAADIGQSKLNLISDGSRRLGLDSVKPRHIDASVYNGDLKERADIVFADLPCSGFGVIHKKPEIRYKDKESIRKLSHIQKQILLNLAHYVKPGGILLYSTCTVFKSENEDVIAAFLEQRCDFIKSSFTLQNIGVASSGDITLWPHRYKTDGFYICKMQKTH